MSDGQKFFDSLSRKACGYQRVYSDVEMIIQEGTNDLRSKLPDEGTDTLCGQVWSASCSQRFLSDVLKLCPCLKVKRQSLRIPDYVNDGSWSLGSWIS
jgi:hypothetical protein